MSALIISLGLVVGIVIGLAGVGDVHPSSSKAAVGAIFVNNVRLGLLLAAGALSFGLLTLTGLIGGAVLVGTVVGASIRLQGAAVTAAGIVPHLVPELLGFSMLGAVGLSTPYAAIRRLRAGYIEDDRVRAEVFRRLCATLLGGVGLLLLGAVIESTVSVRLLEVFQ